MMIGMTIRSGQGKTGMGTSILIRIIIGAIMVMLSVRILNVY